MMTTHTLSFAQINLLQDDIAEVIVNEGVTFDERMTETYHDFLTSHLRAPFSLLINKVNSYTYDFKAQQGLATIEEINSMAVVVYKEITRIATESLTSQPRKKAWKLQIFSDREVALQWLLSEQNDTRKSDKTAPE